MAEKFIADYDGLDWLPAGKLSTRYPWSQVGSQTGSIVEGGGAFLGNNGLTMDATGNLAQCLTFAFPNFGTFQRNNTANNGKALYGYGSWIRVDSVAATLATSTLIGFSSLLTPGVIPLVTVSNSTALKLELCLPTNLSTPASNPLKVSLQVGTNYWFYAKFALYPNGNIRASYYLNNIPIQENLTITMTTDPLSTSPMDRVVFFGGVAQCQYTIDDPVVQAVTGDDPEWPSGFTAGVPNNPNIADLPIISSRRVREMELIANGSINEFRSTDESLQNWEAAKSTTAKVQSTERDQTELYKVDATASMNDIMAVKFQINTDTYFSLTSATKDQAADAVSSGVGIINRGGSTLSYVMEETISGEAWDNEKITDAEFGLKTL